MHFSDPQIWNNAVILETPRLLLKEITPERWNYLFANLSDDDLAELFALPDMQRLEKEKEKYRKGMTTHLISFKLFLLIDKNIGKTIGKAGLHNWAAFHNRSETGYIIENEAYKNKGYMTEAFAAILRYGFEAMNLYRIDALIGTDNVPSTRLIKKFGFTKEGVLRAHFNVNGVNVDSVCYSLLKPEYESLKTQIPA